MGSDGRHDFNGDADSKSFPPRDSQSYQVDHRGLSAIHCPGNHFCTGNQKTGMDNPATWLRMKTILALVHNSFPEQDFASEGNCDGSTLKYAFIQKSLWRSTAEADYRVSCAE